MLLARTLEERLVSLYRGGHITGGVYIGKGQEAVSVACGLFLQKGDIFAPLIRDQAGRSAFGEPLIDVTRTYLGSRQGPMRGRDGNIHRGRPGENCLAMISHLGAMVSVVVGSLMAKRFHGEKNFIGLSCIGEGGMQTGSLHEGMNIAAVEQVPLVIVATNNHYAYSTPNDREFACADLVDRAKGYGFEGYSIDGTDLNTCLDVIGSAVQRARAGRPPQLVVASVLRLSGHGEHDDASYVTDEVKRQPFAQDCLKIAEKRIICNRGRTRRESRSKKRSPPRNRKRHLTVRKRIGARFRGASWLINPNEHHLSRGHPRSAGETVARRRARFYLRPGRRRRLRWRV